jgi:hypothetical protein
MTCSLVSEMVLTKVSRQCYAINSSRTFRLPHVPAEYSILSIPRACINLRCGAVLDDATTPKTESIASNYIKLELHLAYAQTAFDH